MAIWLTKDSRVIVQGVTGSEGSRHTRRMLRAGTNIVGGTNPRKAGQQVDFDGVKVPVFVPCVLPSPQCVAMASPQSVVASSQCELPCTTIPALLRYS